MPGLFHRQSPLSSLMTNREELDRIRRELRSTAARRRESSSAMGCFSVRIRIDELELYLERNLHQRLSLADAAYVLGLERTYCSRVFRDCTGMPYSQWDREIRIRIAKVHLVDTDARIGAIGLAVGYDDLTTFERNFRRSAGTSPKQFRKTPPP